MSKRHLYLVRHGHYNSFENPDELGGGLSLIGRDQAFYASKYFEQVSVSAIHSSTMRRALETADILSHNFKEIPIQSTPDLWEVIPVIPERLKESFLDRYPDLTPDKIEAQRMKAERAFAQYFQPLEEGETHEIVVAHGNLIRFLACRALNVSPSIWANMLVYHCSVTRFVVDSVEGTLMLSFNELGHIPRHYWSEI